MTAIVVSGLGFSAFLFCEQGMRCLDGTRCYSASLYVTAFTCLCSLILSRVAVKLDKKHMETTETAENTTDVRVDRTRCILSIVYLPSMCLAVSCFFSFLFFPLFLGVRTVVIWSRILGPVSSYHDSLLEKKSLETRTLSGFERSVAFNVLGLVASGYCSFLKRFSHDRSSSQKNLMERAEVIDGV